MLDEHGYDNSDSETTVVGTYRHLGDTNTAALGYPVDEWEQGI